MTFEAFDAVVLGRDLPEHGLSAGDAGTVLAVHGEEHLRVGFELFDEATAVFTVAVVDVRKVEASDLLSRALSAIGMSMDDMAPPSLSHLDEEGRARMVDVSAKDDTHRVAEAAGRITMRPETLALIQTGGVAKGDVLTVAQVAGIMAAKRTAELIPMCHPLALTGIEVRLTPNEAGSCVDIGATVRTTGKTGVEMEALTAVSVAALTVYDMCKAVDREMRVEAVRLVRKSGGKSGEIFLQ